MARGVPRTTIEVAWFGEIIFWVTGLLTNKQGGHVEQPCNCNIAITTTNSCCRREIEDIEQGSMTATTGYTAAAVASAHDHWVTDFAEVPKTYPHGLRQLSSSGRSTATLDFRAAAIVHQRNMETSPPFQQCR